MWPAQCSGPRPSGGPRPTVWTAVQPSQPTFTICQHMQVGQSTSHCACQAKAKQNVPLLAANARTLARRCASRLSSSDTYRLMTSSFSHCRGWRAVHVPWGEGRQGKAEQRPATAAAAAACASCYSSHRPGFTSEQPFAARQKRSHTQQTRNVELCLPQPHSTCTAGPAPQPTCSSAMHAISLRVSWMDETGSSTSTSPAGPVRTAEPK